MLFYRDGLEEQIDAKPKVHITSDGHVVESYLVKGKSKYFVTLAGTHWCAHGSTIADAIADAIWKDPSKRPSLDKLKADIQDAGEKRKITLNEFRVLTGACLEGCKRALSQKGLDTSPMTADEVERHFPEWGRKLKEVLGWTND